VPAVNAGGVVNSGSYTAQGVAPGSIVSVFGTNLAASTATASAIPLPTTLSDVTSVTFNDIPAGLYFVSQNQINAQLPFDVLSGGQRHGEHRGYPQHWHIGAAECDRGAASPGIFTTTGNGLGQAFAYDNTTGAIAAPTGTVVGSFLTAPISVSSGHALIIACTGLGAVTPSIADYVAASDGTVRNTLLQPAVLIGGVPAQFVYSVLSPQFVSEYQIGVIPDPSTPTGDASVHTDTDWRRDDDGPSHHRARPVKISGTDHSRFERVYRRFSRPVVQPLDIVNEAGARGRAPKRRTPQLPSSRTPQSATRADPGQCPTMSHTPRAREKLL
jgi:uncharacterized protein (TIGR03437 family)